MACRANRRNLVLLIAIGALYALLATESMGETLHAADQSARRFSAEVKPLPTLLSLLPGTTAAAAGVELKLVSHLSLFADLSHTSVRLADDDLAQAQADQADSSLENGDASVPRTRATTTAALGLRYYGVTTGDSWYAGGRIGGGPSEVQWAYRDERLDDHSYAVFGEAQAGYRWLWASGVLVRLGFGFGWQATEGREITAAAESGQGFENAKTDIEKRSPGRPTTVTSVDLGVGLAF